MLMPASNTICVLSHWEIVRYLMLLGFPGVPALFHSKGVSITRIPAAQVWTSLMAPPCELPTVCETSTMQQLDEDSAMTQGEAKTCGNQIQ